MADEPVVNTPLARNLAVTTQLQLVGTAGRLAQQIRDLESLAPKFRTSGLIRKITRPQPLNVHAAGVATATPTQRIVGGFLFAAGAVRQDLIVDHNRIRSGTQDSVCAIDDIDYEDQRVRLQLAAIQQSYELADAAMRDGEARDLIIVDGPLVLYRSMDAPNKNPQFSAHARSYQAAHDAALSFWERHRERMFPWSENGPALVSVAGDRFGAILKVAQRDLRTKEGRSYVLPCEAIDFSSLNDSGEVKRVILTIGEKRFLRGLLGPFTRTVAYQLNVDNPRMAPREITQEGVIGFHYKGSEGTDPRFVQLVGPKDMWSSEGLDRIAGQLLALSAVGGLRANPLPLSLAARRLTPLKPFLINFAREVHAQLRSRRIENTWLQDLDALD